MYKKSKISLIFPCRDEAEAIKKTLLRVPDIVDEVIVVDNLSSDNTVDIAQLLGAKVLTEPRIKNGIGYGYALATGIRNSSGDFIVCMDGDGSYPVEKISSIIDYINRNKVDFVSCNRLPVLNPKKMSWIRMLGVRILNITIYLLYGYPIKDSLTGMWVFNKKILPYMNLYEGDWNFSLEIKLSAIHNKYIQFSEYHVPYQDRVFNQSKQSIFKTGLRHLGYLISKRFLFQTNLFSQHQLSLLAEK